MDTGSLAWSNPPTCQNAQLTLYNCQSRIKNRHRIIRMVRATKMLECTTHLLWLPEQDPEWIWDHQHDEGHHHARMHNLPSMITRAGSRMDMGHQHDQSHQCARMHNSPPMIARVGSRMDMGSSEWWEPLTCQNAQLTNYDCQSRIKNGQGIISMISSNNIPDCSTHQLWLPKQDEEWMWDHQHDQSHQHANMHNSPPMIARAGSRMNTGLSAWSKPPAH